MKFITDRFEKSAKFVLFVFAAALPLWFIPSANIGIDSGREITFGTLILIALILWLLHALSAGRMRYVSSPVLWMGILAAVVFSAATALSKAPLVSALFADAGAEKLSSLAAMLALMALVGMVLRRREDAGTLLFILIFSGAVSAVVTFLQLTLHISLFSHAGISAGTDANAIGTVNGLALFYAALSAAGAGLALSRASAGWNAWVRRAMGAAMLIFFADIALINFFAAWIVLFGASVFLFGLAVIQNRMAAGQLPVTGNRLPVTKFDWRQWAALGMAVVAAVMILARPTVPGITLPPEVSPSLSATLSIAGSVFKENARAAFFGSGPGTFGMDWTRYKDASLNQTIFWNVGFGQGNSWAATLLATTGILGALAFALLAVGGLFIFLRIFLSDSDGRGSMRYGDDPLAMAGMLGYTAGAMIVFLYPSNFSLGILMFLFAGLLLRLLAVPAPELTDVESAEPSGQDTMPSRDGQSWNSDDEVAFARQRGATEAGSMDSMEGNTGIGTRHGFWETEERIARFETPWAVFLSSLGVIFFLALSVAGLYAQLGRVRAAMASGAGVAAANRGNMDEAIADLERAAALESNNFRTQQLLAAVRTEKIRGIIRRAAGGENVAQDFQSAVSSAVQNVGQAEALGPADAGVWRTAGAFYELIIPFVPGAERLAFSSYQKSADLSPTDPSVYVDWGRSGLAFTDRIQLAINQSKDDKEKAQLADARKSNLEQIAVVFQKAADLKPDYAPAHFLLAQTQIRLGNIDSAIQSVENAKQAAPFDIGVAFQLGLLYYQKNDLDRAAAEFARAISLNENYSNARYFLGLIYDKKGDKERAMEQFTKIAAVNPDNKEVKTILDNLALGHEALAGLVPPAAPPEKRIEAPVKEQGPRAIPQK